MSALTTTRAVALNGLEANVVDVETHVGNGLVLFTIVGLPDATVRESKERVRAALQSCGVDWFSQRVTVNLSPADIPKAGSAFDLAIAMGLMGARRMVLPERISDIVFIAELGLDGTLRAVRGVLPAVMGAVKAGFRSVVVSADNEAEAALVPQAQVRAFTHLSQVVHEFGGKLAPVVDLVVTKRGCSPVSGRAELVEPVDLGDVRGQGHAVEALIVAAAGGHHLFLVGEPGAGKSMLARCLPTILPPLNDDQAIEVSSIYSLVGRLGTVGGLRREPPIERPHHSASLAAMVGGGSQSVRPGAVTLAHHGVLVLDEAAEFSARALDSLRQPLENGTISVNRSRYQVVLPARFQLVMTANPCPCGFAISRHHSCVCSSVQQRRYFSRISGPLRDRVDIQITMLAPDGAALAEVSDHTSASARDLVMGARERQHYRWRQMSAGGQTLNAQLSGKFLRRWAPVDDSVSEHLDQAVSHGRLSLRGADRVTRLALTIADLRSAERVDFADLTTALQLRSGHSHGF